MCICGKMLLLAFLNSLNQANRAKGGLATDAHRLTQIRRMIRRGFSSHLALHLSVKICVHLWQNAFACSSEFMTPDERPGIV